jgi:hypothetical protein
MEQMVVIQFSQLSHQLAVDMVVGIAMVPLVAQEAVEVV